MAGESHAEFQPQTEEFNIPTSKNLPEGRRILLGIHLLSKFQKRLLSSPPLDIIILTDVTYR